MVPFKKIHIYTTNECLTRNFLLHSLDRRQAVFLVALRGIALIWHKQNDVRFATCSALSLLLVQFVRLISAKPLQGSRQLETSVGN